MSNFNVDQYANDRIGIFFPGNPWTLTGQCVSLVKWFLQEGTLVPDPQSARGDAKDFGNTLVEQGHAVEVTEASRLPGDLVAWPEDGAGSGHIAVQLSGDRVFEENVAVDGTPSATIPDGRGGNTVVYASRISPLYQSWRKGRPRFYRINSYLGGETVSKPTYSEVLSHFRTYQGSDPTEQQMNYYVAREWGVLNGDLLQVNYDLSERLKKELAKGPTIIEKTVSVPVEKIVEKEVIKSDDERSIGDLLMAVFKKLSRIK